MNWRQIQKTNFISTESLSTYLGIPIPKHPFALNVPLRLAEKMEKGNKEDPLFRQFVTTEEEFLKDPSFKEDPVDDAAFLKAPKLIKKYQGRALLTVTSACAMHCRYCFRQNFDYQKGDFEAELKAIQEDPSIFEIILSGGDPLSLSDQKLALLLNKLSAIPHLQLIRFHTRFPIGIPERIDESFLNLLQSIQKQLIFVIHCNHPKELDGDVLHALKKIQRLGIPVLNQAVLLKGINDNLETLKELCLTLVSHGILPYYIHQLDQVQGAQHFEVDSLKGKELMTALRGSLPGYAVPLFVAEIPHKPNKTPLHPFDGFETKNLQTLLQNTSCQL
ncbi:MAG: KamA family radical SAM protein [Simkaniaceae bacterium]|nr:KamA family radical SAM protein [Simkaniaceae bacterium]